MLHKYSDVSGRKKPRIFGDPKKHLQYGENTFMIVTNTKQLRYSL